MGVLKGELAKIKASSEDAEFDIATQKLEVKKREDTIAAKDL